MGYVYVVGEDGAVTFEAEPAYIGEAPNFMIVLQKADSYTDDEIDAKYLDGEESEGESEE